MNHYMLAMTERQYRALLSLLGMYVVESAKPQSAMPGAFALATDVNDEETTASDLLALVLNGVCQISDRYRAFDKFVCPVADRYQVADSAVCCCGHVRSSHRYDGDDSSCRFGTLGDTVTGRAPQACTCAQFVERGR